MKIIQTEMAQLKVKARAALPPCWPAPPSRTATTSCRCALTVLLECIEEAASESIKWKEHMCK